MSKELTMRNDEVVDADEHECRNCGSAVLVDEYGRGEIPAAVPPAMGVICSVECYARIRHGERKRILSEVEDTDE